MKRRSLAAMPLLLAMLLYAQLDCAPLTASLLLALTGAAVAIGPRVRARPAEQWIAAAASALAVFSLRSALVDEADVLCGLESGWSGLAVTALLHAVTRLVVRRPHGGLAGTYGVGAVALIACGQTLSGWLYPASACAYLLAALLSLRAQDAARPRWRQLLGRSRALSVLIPVLAVSVAFGTSAVLVPLDRWLQEHFERAYLARRARAGFSGDRMHLGSIERMLSSSRVVLRVYGDADYLRGAVYDRYGSGSGRWARGTSERPERVPVRSAPEVDPAAGSSGAQVEVRRVGAKRDRFFVPLAARAFGSVDAWLHFDRMGIVLPATPESGDWIRFRPVGEEREVGRPAPPSPADLHVAPELLAPLLQLGQRWDVPRDDPRAALDRLIERLHGDYDYAIGVPRPAGADPVLDFLLERREGHCEYFASALVLLARAHGIPARVVTGYRVTEHNPLGGYALVREQNAHAWAEVYLPGAAADAAPRWRRVDATPADSQPQNRPAQTPWLPAAADALRERVSLAVAWFEARSAAELWTWIAFAAALLGALIWWRGLAEGSARARHGAGDYPPPPRALLRLLRALERRGSPRGPGETLEALGARVAEREVRAQLTRYAALRYGGQGDRCAVETDLERLASRLR